MAYLRDRAVKNFKPLVFDISLTLTFKNLKSHIAAAIKEACYETDARFYNIANEVHEILTMSLEPGIEVADGLSKVIDRTIKNTVAIGCDLSVIVEGVFIGAFRSSPFNAEEAQKTMRVLIKEILKALFKHKGNLRQAMEGLLAAIILVVNEFNLNVQEPLIIAREDILTFAKELDPKFAEELEEVFPNSDDSTGQLYFAMLSARVMLKLPPEAIGPSTVIKHRSFRLSKSVALK